MARIAQRAFGPCIRPGLHLTQSLMKGQDEHFFVPAELVSGRIHGESPVPSPETPAQTMPCWRGQRFP